MSLLCMHVCVTQKSVCVAVIALYQSVALQQHITSDPDMTQKFFYDSDDLHLGPFFFGKHPNTE